VENPAGSRGDCCGFEGADDCAAVGEVAVDVGADLDAALEAVGETGEDGSAATPSPVLMHPVICVTPSMLPMTANASQRILALHSPGSSMCGFGRR
jgi:hypothetical protein